MNKSRTRFLHDLNTFLAFIRGAETVIRENAWHPRMPPCTEERYWNDSFAQSYEALRPYLNSVKNERLFAVPSGIQNCPTSFLAETAVEAWMFFLNPPEVLFGEASVLSSSAYLAIKSEAMGELHTVEAGQLSHQKSNASSQKARRTAEVIALNAHLLDHHFPKGGAVQTRTLSSKELKSRFGWSQSKVSRRMAQLFDARNGMEVYNAVFGTHSTLRGYRKRYDSTTIDIDAVWTDRAWYDGDDDDADGGPIPVPA